MGQLRGLSEIDDKKLYSDIWDRLLGNIRISSQDEYCANLIIIASHFD